MADEIKRTYTIPLRRGFCNTPRHKRTNKAVSVLKIFLQQHMKSTDVKLGKHLNDFLWENGIRNPPPRVRVNVIKDKEGVVKAELEGKEYVEFKMQEKTDRNQTMKEKLQSKVAGATSKEEKVEEKTETKSEVKKEATKPKPAPKPKTETKKEAPKAATKPKAEIKPVEKKEEKPKASPEKQASTSEKTTKTETNTQNTDKVPSEKSRQE